MNGEDPFAIPSTFDPSQLVAISEGFPNWKALRVPMKVFISPGKQPTFETVAADQVCSDLPGRPRSLPIVWLVDPATIETFLSVVALTFCNPWSEIVDVSGRTVIVKTASNYGPDAHSKLAGQLIGSDYPCEDFRVVGNLIYARLKTREQRRIEGACLDFELAEFTKPFAPLNTDGRAWVDCDQSAEEPAQPAEQPYVPNPSGQLRGTAKLVFETTPENKAISIQKLTDMCVKQMPKPEGKDRRHTYVQIAIRKLCDKGLLFVQGENQELVCRNNVTEEPSE